MALKKSKGYTVMELLTVIAIIAIVAAISFPVWASSRKKSGERVTENFLHQTWVALELYRQDSDPSSLTLGTSSQIGLPNIDGFYSLLKRSNLKWWPHAGSRGAYGPNYYPFDPSDFVVPDHEVFYTRQLTEWLAYSRKNQEQAVLVGDFNHSADCGKGGDPRCFYIGFGVRLSGSLCRRSRTGNVFSPSWWE